MTRMASEAKLLTAVVPCYNSAPYMERAVSGLLAGGGEMDILLVDDGSKDDTGKIADRLASEHPGVVRVIHQPNGGHGSGLNRGIETAKGLYFKVVDSDDRIDPEALQALLTLLRDHASSGRQADLVVHDYAYDREETHNVFSMTYESVMPQGRLFQWSECKRFGVSKQFLIHALVYRTALLREHDFRLPEHTFYEDNVYVYKPLPWTKNLLYLHQKVYGYNVGRAGQSVNEENLLKRLDQLTNMVTQMTTSWRKAQLDALPRPLETYMINNAASQIWSLSALHFIGYGDKGRALHETMWRKIEDFDPALYRALIRTPMGAMAHFKTRPGRWLVKSMYHLGHKIMKFG